MAKEVVEAPIVGKIVKIHVQNGDQVKEGDVICEIEAMKMENPIVAPVAGKINEIKVSVGQVVQIGDVIAIIEY